MARVSKKSEKEKMIVLPIPFNPRLPDVSPILRQFWQVAVERNPAIKTVMKTPPIPSYRRPKNLRDEVVQAKFLNQHLTRRSGTKVDLSAVWQLGATAAVSAGTLRNTRHLTQASPGQFIQPQTAIQAGVYIPAGVRKVALVQTT